MAFDFQGARNAGYTDAEIIEGIAKSSGKTVDANGALKAGYTAEEIVAGLGGGQKSTGTADALRQGAADVVGGLGETAEQYLGKGSISEALKGAASKVGPDDYERARIYSDKEGLTLSNAPRAAIEAAPGLAATVTAYRAGRRVHPLVGALAAGATSLGFGLGNEAKRSADARTGEAGTAPDAQDKARALVYGIPSAALDATGAGRLASGAAKGVGTAGVGSALRNYATKIGVEGGTEAAQEALAQAGSTVGTKGGTRFSPEDIADSGLRGAATGAGYAAPKALKETSNSIRLAKFGGDNADASTDVANRLTQAAGGDLSDTKKAAKAFTDVSGDLHNELLTAVKDARTSGTLQPDAALDNAIARSQKGEALNTADRDALESAPSELKDLARRVTVLAELKKQNRGDADNFKGGTSARLEKGVRALVNPTGAVVGGGLAYAGLTGNAALMGSTALPGLAAVAGGYGAARAVDRFTGARSPLQRFAKQFADGQVPQRAGPALAAPVDDGPIPTGPWNPPLAPQVGTFGKGARPPEPGPQEPAPTGPWNMPPSPQVGTFGKGPRPPEAPPEAPFDGKLPPEMLANLKAMSKRVKAKSKAMAAASETDDESVIPAFLPNRQDIPAFLPKRPLAPIVAKVTKANGKVKEKTQPTQQLPPEDGSVKTAKVFLDDGALMGDKPRAAVILPDGRLVEMSQEYGRTKKWQGLGHHARYAAEVGGDNYLEVTAYGSSSVSVSPRANFELTQQQKTTLAALQAEARRRPETHLMVEAGEQPKPKGPYVPDAKKINFKTVDGDEAFPFHDKHDLTPEEFGAAMGAMRSAEGKFTSPEYEAGTARRVAAKYKLADAIVAAAPTLPLAKIRSQLLVVDSASKAEAYRTHLLTQVKTAKAKAAVLTAFSNEAITDAWKRTRKK